MTRFRPLPVALTFFLTACGAASPNAESPSASAEGSPASADLAPPVPVHHAGRTLVTQNPEDFRPSDPSAPVERVVGDSAVPVPRGEATTVPAARAMANGLDSDRVRSVIRGGQARFRHCFDRFRQSHPDAADARVSVHFVVDPQGRVASAEAASADPDDPELARCMVTVVKALQFPAADTPSDVTFPFSFQTAAGD